MHIVFGLYLEGLQPHPPKTVAGEAILGPQGLLEVLETQLGLPPSTVHQSEVAFSYLRCLHEVSSPDRFFHRSLEVDPVNVARTLLVWREQWYKSGWDGTFPEGVPARLADMAAVEALARERVPLGLGQRIQRVAEALSERTTQIERVELHTPLEDFPLAWQRVLAALPCEPAFGLKLSPAGRQDSDLARVQTRLLALAVGDEDGGEAAESLQGDGSIIVVESASRDLSADAVAEYLHAMHGDTQTLLIAEWDGVILDNALERAGLPRCGFRRHTRFRAATQVLKLALALVWEPVNPHRVLQFLLHPTAPLPRWVRSRLSDAVAESPGIGGPNWVDAIERIGEIQRERHEAEEAKVAALRSEIAYWLEGDRFDPTDGAPLEVLLERTQRVSNWATARLHAVEGEADATLFGVAHAQAEALLTELAGLREAGEERIDRMALEQRIDEVTTDTPDPSTYEEAGHVRATTSPAVVTTPWPTVIWWNLAPVRGTVSYPWSRRELAALRTSGVGLPEVEEVVRRQSRNWLRPICHATERVLLVVQDDGSGTHPLLTRIKNLFPGIEPLRIEPALVEGEGTLEPLEVPTRELALKPLPAPRRWWSLPDDCTIPLREVESYSSLSKLCDFPHGWVLQYAARLRAGGAAEVMDGSRLYGTLGHRLFEEFFRAHGDWHRMSDLDVLAWVRAELPTLVVHEGAVLLEPGRGMDYQRVAATLERSLVRFLTHLRSAGIEQVTPEASGEVPFADRRLTGSIDMVLSGGNSERAVLDVKWAGENYRRDLLLGNRTVQLATYSFLQKSLNESEVWPHGAFFILATGNVLAADASRFPNAVVYPSEDGEGTAELWRRLLNTYEWRWTQLRRGQIEVVTDFTYPDEWSTPPEAGLRPVPGGDQFDDFARLTGWEDSR